MQCSAFVFQNKLRTIAFGSHTNVHLLLRISLCLEIAIVKCFSDLVLRICYFQSSLEVKSTYKAVKLMVYVQNSDNHRAAIFVEPLCTYCSYAQFDGLD